jgi:TatD DNase family protein
MLPPLIDTHAHLDDEKFGDELPAILVRAAAAGLRQIISVATTAASSRATAKLAQEHPLVLATVGIHPNNAAQAGPSDWDGVLQLIGTPRVVGVGETGLDRHWDFTPFPLQEDYFARHLALSRRTGLPIVIHCREADADVLRMLREEFDRHGPIQGIMHSFSSDAALAGACLAMGLHISFAGMLTYKNADALRQVAKGIPRERLLVETDSPYLAPVPMRGKRNEPAFVTHTAATLAGLHGLTAKDMAEQTTKNALALFGRTGL